MDVLKNIEMYKIVPVVVLEDENDAVPLAKALIDGGLPVAEVTFRTEAAAESIRRMTEACPEMLVGAGTIRTVEQAKRAIEAGARFIVTAGFSEAVTKYVTEQQIPIVPGACTPSELMQLLDYDLYLAKFFPAEAFGGLKTIKALQGPFPMMRFMPTGGINENNIKEYLDDPKIAACGGSWMVKNSLIKNKEFDQITRLTKEAVQLINGQ